MKEEGQCCVSGCNQMKTCGEGKDVKKSIRWSSEKKKESEEEGKERRRKEKGSEDSVTTENQANGAGVTFVSV